MAQVFRLPRIGDALAEATIQEWYVGVGDQVVRDQFVCSVETSKAVVDVPCPHGGRVLYLGGSVGDVVALDEVLIVVGEPGEAWSPANAETEATRAPEDRSASSSAALTPTAAAAIKILPAARRAAAAAGIDVATVHPTGVGGVITAEDIENAKRTAHAQENAVPTERRPMTARRRAIARNLLRASQEMALASMAWQVDMTNLLARRDELQATRGEKPPLDALLVAAVLPLLTEFPEFNGYIDGNDFMLYQHCNVGIAVGSIDGLTVPVIRRANELDLNALCAEVNRLSRAAMSQQLAPADLTSLTFTVSNVGAVGAAWGGSAIIPNNTAAMLSVGRALDRPVVTDGSISIAKISHIAVTYDHRAFDGAHAAKFLRRLQGVLEHPTFV